MINEVWKDIKGYEGLYQVSSLGRVKSLPKYHFNYCRILKPVKTAGYLRVCLHKSFNQKDHLIHRLVAEAFIPNPANLPQVNHKDEDKNNNNVSNLEWCTSEYNMNYGTRLSKVSAPVIMCEKDGKVIEEFNSISSAHKKYRYSTGSISECCNGKRNSAYGFIWKFNFLMKNDYGKSD